MKLAEIFKIGVTFLSLEGSGVVKLVEQAIPNPVVNQINALRLQSRNMGNFQVRYDPRVIIGRANW